MINFDDRYKAVEDFLCDTIDSAFNDGIVCYKEFNMGEPESRACFISGTRAPVDDQQTVDRYSITFKTTATSRSDATTVITNLRKIFPIYNKTLPNGVVISITIGYITMPIKTMIESEVRYVVTAQMQATVS